MKKLSEVSMPVQKKSLKNTQRAAALLAAVAAGFSAAAVNAAVDGVVDNGEYGLTLATQNTGTGFGNDVSELNQAFANYTPGGDLGLALTGNLEGNGNGLIIFIDSKAGGGIANSFGGGYGQLGSIGGARVDDWGNDTDGGAGVFTPTGGASVLAPNFNPDYAIEINAYGNTAYYTNIIDLSVPNDPSSTNRDVYLGSNSRRTVGTDPTAASATQTYYRDGGLTDSGDVTHAFDNTNTAGVSDTDASTANTATSGYEALFESQFLGYTPGQALRAMAFITNDNGGYLSNQFLTPLGSGTPNLGGPGGDGGTPLFNSQFYGDRFYMNIFTPTTSTNGGPWNSATWTGGVAPNGVEAAARLVSTASSTIAMSPGGVTLGYLEIDNPAGYTINPGPGQALTFNGGNGAAILAVTQGAQTINAKVNVITDTRVNTATGTSVSLTNGLGISANKTLTKAGEGGITLGGTMTNGAGASIAVDAGTAVINSDLGAGLSVTDQPNLYASTPGGGPGATITLNSNQFLRNIAANPVSHIVLSQNGARAIVANELFTSGTGKVNLTDNNMILHASPIGVATPIDPNNPGLGGTYDGIQGKVQTGLNGGTWTGPGIVTDQADALALLTTLAVNSAEQGLSMTPTETRMWNGQSIVGTDTLIMYTYAGDGNLDGVVNADDYALIDLYSQVPGESGYGRGDFNYDGRINADDYALIDANIQRQNGSYADGLPRGIGGGSATAGLTAVPEPGSISLLSIGAAALLRRRRRNA
jgi:hypothetical protein